MIGRRMGAFFAGLLGFLAGAGLPVSVDEKAALRLTSGVAKHVRRTKGSVPPQTWKERPHRRQYVPGSPHRRSVRFVYSRTDRQASREARMRVIAHNDARTNQETKLRLEKKGLRVA
jgi:hypothetical protein